MGFTEYALLIVLVLAIPLAIAGAVTLWSLQQARYRPKRRRSGSVASDADARERPKSTDDRAEGSSA